MRPRVERWLVIGLLLATTAYAVAEDLTLTTYYPSPRGVYNELRTSGDVGIGDIATAPAARLHVTRIDDAGPVLRLDDQATDNTPVVVDSTGNVGIGTPTPGSQLSVNGGASLGSGYAATAAPTDGLIVQGNVGIGTPSPTGAPSPTNSIATGNLDVNDIYVRSADRWVSEGAGLTYVGECSVPYNTGDNSCKCNAGETIMTVTAVTVLRPANCMVEDQNSPLVRGRCPVSNYVLCTFACFR